MKPYVDVRRLKEEIPIEIVLRRMGGEVLGGSWDRWAPALCGFHGDTNPSARVHRGFGRFKCFVCDVRGDIVDLAMEWLGTKDFRRAMTWLQENFR